MKFGKQLLKAQRPEWARNYIAYKNLKQAISQAERAKLQPSDYDDAVTAFFFQLDRELEKVNSFYVYKRTEMERRLRILSDKYQTLVVDQPPPLFAAAGSPVITTTAAADGVESTTTSMAHAGSSHADPVQRETLMSSLIETRQQMHKILKFASLNATGFRKILKKFDKKLGKQTQETYLSTKVNVLPFANPKGLEDTLEQLEDVIRKLQGVMDDHQEWFRHVGNTSTTNTVYTSVESPTSPRRTHIPGALKHRLDGLSHEDDEAIIECLKSDNAGVFEEILTRLGLPTMLRRRAHPDGSVSTSNLGTSVAAMAASTANDKNTINNHSTASFPSPVMFHQNPSAHSLAAGHSRSFTFYTRLANSLMRRACHYKAKQCLAYLVKAGVDLSGADDMNERSFVHLLVISGGAFHRLESLHSTFRQRTQGWMHDYALALPFDDEEEDQSDGVRFKDDPELLSFILELSEAAASHLVVPDIFGRIPLHYAALYGYHRIAKVLVRYSERFEPAHVNAAVHVVDAPAKRKQPLGSSWVDHEGHSSLFYAVLRGHPDVVRVLIDLENVDVDDCSVASVGQLSSVPIAPSTLAIASSPNMKSNIIPKVNIYSHTPLALACKFGHAEIAKLLLDRGANVDFQDEDGETPLHLAAKHGFLDCVDLLLNPHKHITSPKVPLKKAAVDVREKLNGYTPLFHAAIEGHTGCVELLLQAGSNVALADFDDWTAHEHAVFRGHLKLAKLLKTTTNHHDAAFVVSSPRLSPTDDEEDDEPDTLNGVKRSYGHNYLKDQCMVIINLGVNDIRKNVPAIQLNSNAPTIYPSLSMVVSATNAVGEPAIVDLPAKDTFDPIIFYSHQGKPNLNDINIRFDLQPTYGAKKQILGRATSVLSIFNRDYFGSATSTPFSSNMSTPRGSQTAVDGTSTSWARTGPNGSGGRLSIPLTNANLETIGMVNFEYIIVMPFQHPNLSIGSKQTYWKSVSTKVIGHRGAGANRKFSGGAGNLQIGENTVLSLVTAASLGAEYVEFDVQLTKDHVPVIYHDWIVSETGLEIPVNAVSLKEFKKISPRTNVMFDRSKPRRRAKSGHNNNSWSDDENSSNNGKFLEKSFSLESIDQSVAGLVITDDSASQLTQRHLGGRADMAIKAPFATLEELFRFVPPKTGFNIEVKYPNIRECEKHGLNHAELNVFIDSILKCVYENAGSRSIIFSSFHPEVCLMLNLKQPNYPVFFLTEAGTERSYDSRCNSLQEAIRFAKFADLLGIVTVSDPVIEAPHLVEVIKQNGLLLFTYGQLNNEVKNVELQRKYGVDAVIVDKIRPIVGSMKTSA